LCNKITRSSTCILTFLYMSIALFSHLHDITYGLVGGDSVESCMRSEREIVSCPSVISDRSSHT
jgi:hypothetical protein